MISNNILQLYRDFKDNGGFGIYALDELTDNNDLRKRIDNELKIIEFYKVAYKKSIPLQILENKYLGKKRVNISTRIIIRQENMLCQLIRIHKSNAYDYIMKNISIKGYRNRAYWNEYEEMKNELLL